MWILISAVVSASLLGSMHCVGMCGPLAIWASGIGDRYPTSTMAWATGLYHLGRLVTYATAGLLAGAAGQLLDIGGSALGIQLVAARVVGAAMIVIGSVHLSQLLWARVFSRRAAKTTSPPKPSLLTRTLVRLRPFVFQLPLPMRGFATGLLTALLPCGWLYLFALVAAGTGSYITGPIVMAAFWLGTVPALVGLVTGTQALAVRFRGLIPAAASLMLVIAGGYTASGRGFAKLNSLSDIASLQSEAKTSDSSAGLPDGKPEVPAEQSDTSKSAELLSQQLSELVKTPLPCCAAPEAAQTKSDQSISIPSSD